MKSRKFKINIIILILFFLELLALLLFHYMYAQKFEFKSFMSTLEKKMEEKGEGADYSKLEKFEELFGRYFDNAGVEFALKLMTSFFVMFFTIIALIILVIWQFCDKCGKCKIICDYFLSIYSCLNMTYYVYIAITAKYKIMLDTSRIYTFDEDFNNEIKKNIDFMVIRKIILFCCVIITIFGIIFQFILILRKKYSLKDENNAGDLRPSLESLDLVNAENNI